MKHSLNKSGEYNIKVVSLIPEDIVRTHVSVEQLRSYYLYKLFIVIESY